MREVDPPEPPTHIDQVVGELQTIEPGVQDPEADAAGADAAGAGAAGAFDGIGTTTLPPDGADDGFAEPVEFVGTGKGGEAELGEPGFGAAEASGGAEDAEDAGAAGATGDGAPEPAEPPDPPLEPWPPLVLAEPSAFTTSPPGLGKATSSPSLVVQPLPRLQVYMSGAELKAVSRLAS